MTFLALGRFPLLRAASPGHRCSLVIVALNPSARELCRPRRAQPEISQSEFQAGGPLSSLLVQNCRQLVRQFDSVGMFLIALMLFGKDLFQPLCLPFCRPLIRRPGTMTYEELLAAAVTPEGSHLLETYCVLSATLLDRHCPHLWPSWVSMLNHAARFNSKHLRHEHLKSGSSGRTTWLHCSQINHSGRRDIGLN